MPVPSCPYRQQRGAPGTGHCFEEGLRRFPCALLCCAEMSRAGTTASHKTGTKASLKENSCSGFHSAVAVPARHEQQEQCHPFSPAGEAPSDASFSSFYFGYNCKQHWLHTLRNVSKPGPFISLSNQDFVLLQCSRSNLTHFHSLDRMEAAPGWGFCNSYSPRGAYGPVGWKWWAKERVQSQSWIRNIYGI